MKTINKMKKGFVVLEAIAIITFIATVAATYQNSVEIQKIQEKSYNGFEINEAKTATAGKAFQEVSK